MPFNKTISKYFGERNRGEIFSLLFLCSLIYIPFLNSPFIFDDLIFFHQNNVSVLSNLATQLSLRWFSYITLAETRELFLDVSQPYRLGNLILHAANAVLVFLLLRSLALMTMSPNTKMFTDWSAWLAWLAWLAALFFACNPVATYAVGYLIERSILMATLFTLAMQLTYLRGLVSGKKRWLILSVAFYFFAVFSKEQSLMAPAIIIATTIMLRSNRKANWPALWATWLSYLLIAILIIMRVKGVLGTAYEHDAVSLLGQQKLAENTSIVHLLSFFTQSGLFFKYLFLWWLPNPAWMSIDMRETFSNSWQTWQNWLKMSAFLSYGFIAFVLLLRKDKFRLLGWGLLYPWLFFIPEFSTIRVQEPFVLYRSYLWIPGMLVLITLAAQSIPSRKGFIVLGSLIALILVPLSWNRLWVMADDYRLWNDAALLLESETTPGAARIFYNRGNAELSKEKWADALADFERVITIDPKIEQVYANMGAAYINLKQYQQAITAFDQAIAIKPAYAQAYFGKGIALKRLHDDAAAMTAMEKSCELKNMSACAIVSLSRAAGARREK